MTMTNNNGRQNALKDYVEVNVRVERFYEKFPEGRISTQLLSWENGIVVMKAEVYRSYTDSVPSATGHAYEKEGSTFINKTSALENCETSAVGRALALLGFEIKKSIASKEEVENAKLNQKNESSSISKETILSKWILLGGTKENFDEWYQNQTQKYNHNQIDTYLTKKLMDKQKGA
jgi:hypothetical protein